MCLASNIARRSGSASYYARLAVPRDLQAAIGRRELWESLRTKDAREARARIGAVLARWHAEFEALRRKRDMTEDDLRAATWAHYEDELAAHRLERQQHKTGAEIEAAQADLVAKAQSGEIEWPESEAGQTLLGVDLAAMRSRPEVQARFRAVRKRTLEQHLARGETALVADAVNALIVREGFDLLPGSPGYRDLAQRLQRADLEALRRAEEQDRGDFTGRPIDPVVVPPSRAAIVVAAPGESILELFDLFAAENPKRIKLDTLRVNRQVIGMFVEFVGPALPASAIDKKRHVFPWKTALRAYPIRAAEVGAFKGMAFRKIIETNQRLGRPTLSDKTVNRYLSALAGFCAWAVKNGHIDSNPVTGMLIDKDKSPSKIGSYASADLALIFKSPLFVGCTADGREHKPGDHRPRDHRYWLPLLALYTGARMGELAQLLVADVREDRDRWIIHITREGDARKSTKTAGSQRVVPVHPELVRLGFLAFHARQTKGNTGRLFPEIEPDARGMLTGNYSRFWGRYLKRIGVKVDRSVNFHSFRHGLMDALRRAGFRDEEFGFLVGHAKATTTGRYGNLAEGEFMQRCKLIDAVAFPGLDLRHLYDS